MAWSCDLGDRGRNAMVRRLQEDSPAKPQGLYRSVCSRNEGQEESELQDRQSKEEVQGEVGGGPGPMRWAL